MAPPSPARLYATLVAAALVVLGLAGFFSSLSWLNFLYVAGGALGLLLAGAAPRAFALCAGVAYSGLAIFTFADSGWLHLAVGLLGLAAYAATPRPMRGSKSTNYVGKEPRNRKATEPREQKTSEPRTQTAGKGS